MKLINHLPNVWRESSEVSALVESMQTEIDKLYAEYENFYNEMYVSTANKAIEKWERMCGLPSIESKPLDTRRSAVMAKLRGSGTCTKDKLHDIARSYDCGEIEIYEDYANYKIKITFISKTGIPKNINGFKAALTAAIPAHLNVSYIYTYRRWGEFANKKWSDLEPFTWDEVKNMEVIE